MMYGKANASFKGVNVNSSDPQDISFNDAQSFKYAGDQKITLEIHDLSASGVGLGSVIVDGIHEDDGAMVGYADTLNMTITVANGKATISS